MSNDKTKQRINDLVDAALHHLQADGTVDRGGLANVLRALRAITDQCHCDIIIVDPMTQCLGFAFDMKEVKSWPTWLCDYSVVQEATDKGWIVELRKEPFIPRLGKSFIISGLSDEGMAEFLRRLPTTHRLNQKLGALTIGETERLLGSEPSQPVKVPEFFTTNCSEEDFTLDNPIEPDCITHEQTDECGFDRNASHTEDTYVCTCGWRAAPKPNYKS